MVVFCAYRYDSKSKLWQEVKGKNWAAKLCFAPAFSDSKSIVFQGIHMNSLLIQARLPLRRCKLSKVVPTSTSCLRTAGILSAQVVCKLLIQKYWNIECPTLSQTRVLIHQDACASCEEALGENNHLIQCPKCSRLVAEKGIAVHDFNVHETCESIEHVLRSLPPLNSTRSADGGN